MQNSKIYTIFAEVNGVGKSTLFQSDKSNDLGVHLNTDEFIREHGQGNFKITGRML